MKFNEYELVLSNNKLKLNSIKQFEEYFDCMQSIMLFMVNQYNIVDSAIEKSFILSLDSQGNLTGIIQVGIGDHKSSNFSLSTGLKFLLLNNAYSCIFIHNHIKGTELKPSQDDIKFHMMANQLCSILNINIAANVILQNDEKYYDILLEREVEI